MRVDEKIAELERIRRMKEQLEQAEQDGPADGGKLTVEEALEGIREGGLFWGMGKGWNLKPGSTSRQRSRLWCSGISTRHRRKRIAALSW